MKHLTAIAVAGVLAASVASRRRRRHHRRRLDLRLPDLRQMGLRPIRGVPAGMDLDDQSIGSGGGIKQIEAERPSPLVLRVHACSWR